MRLLSLGLALALVATAAGQNPPISSVSPPTSPALLPIYRIPDVGRGIDITTDQIFRLNNATVKAEAAFREQLARLPNIPPGERVLAVRTVEARVLAEWDKTAREVLGEKQFGRYRQLRAQYSGFDALRDPELGGRLNLTPSQEKELAAATEWSRHQMAVINRQTDPERARKMYGDYRKELQERLDRFLTPEQQRVWREATGEPYKFEGYLPPPR